jgi:hypothetical protein
MTLMQLLVLTARAWVPPVAVRGAPGDPIHPPVDSFVGAVVEYATGDTVSVSAGWAAVVAPLSDAAVCMPETHTQCAGVLFAYNLGDADINLTVRDPVAILLAQPGQGVTPLFVTGHPESEISDNALILFDTPVICATTGLIFVSYVDRRLGMTRLSVVTASDADGGSVSCHDRYGTGGPAGQQEFRSWEDEVAAKCIQVFADGPVDGLADLTADKTALIALVVSGVALGLVVILALYMLACRCTTPAIVPLPRSLTESLT